MKGARHELLAALCAGLAGCTGPELVALRAEGLVGGAPAPTAVVLTAGEQRAIGALLLAGGATCTAWLASNRHVITAAHCVSALPEARRYDVLWPDGTLSPVATVALHASLDVAVLGLGAAADATPLAFSRGALTAAGTRVELAGAGVGNPAGRLVQFAPHLVTRVDPTELSIEGEGGSATCRGDSGGPLIATGDAGVEVIGIASTGAADCSGRGQASRLDVAQAWLTAQLSQAPPFVPPCTATAPTCEGDVLVVCERGYARARPCLEEGRRCGWAGAAMSCLSAACGEVDARGACAQATARWCGGGVLEELDCEAQGLSCDWVAALGRVGCVAAPPTGRRDGGAGGEDAGTAQPHGEPQSGCSSVGAPFAAGAWLVLRRLARRLRAVRPDLRGSPEPGRSDDAVGGSEEIDTRSRD